MPYIVNIFYNLVIKPTQINPFAVYHAFLFFPALDLFLRLNIFVSRTDNKVRRWNMARIAIEPALSNVKDYLSGMGFKVETIDVSKETGSLRGYDAIVVTGLSTNLLGMSNTRSKAPVINADGLTPEEVAGKIKNSLS